MTQQFYKNMALWVVILLMILLLVTMLRQSQTAPTEIPYSDFVAKVENGEVARVEKLLNERPRRRLEYRTPSEVLAKRM